MKKIFFIVLCILCVAFISFNSMQNGVTSDQRSRKIANKVYNLIKAESSIEIENDIRRLIRKSLEIQSIQVQGEDELSEENLDSFVRRVAHLTEFFLLAFIFALTLNVLKVRWYNIVIYTLFITLFIGVIDEFSRQFIKGRHGNIDDAVLDFMGGVLGGLVFYQFKLVLYVIKKIVKLLYKKLRMYRKQIDFINLKNK